MKTGIYPYSSWPCLLTPPPSHQNRISHTVSSLNSPLTSHLYLEPCLTSWNFILSHPTWNQTHHLDPTCTTYLLQIRISQVLLFTIITHKILNPPQPPSYPNPNNIMNPFKMYNSALFAIYNSYHALSSHYFNPTKIYSVGWWMILSSSYMILWKMQVD